MFCFCFLRNHQLDIYSNTSSITATPEELKWKSLRAGRINSQLKMFHKIINKLIEIGPEYVSRLDQQGLGEIALQNVSRLAPEQTASKTPIFPETAIPSLEQYSHQQPKSPSCYLTLW